MNTNTYFLPVAVVAAGLLIAGAVMWNGSRAPQPAGTPQGIARETIDVSELKTQGAPFIGRVDAPLTIAFWSDFQCPYCKSFEVGGVPQIPTPPAFPEIVKKYVDTGKVKVILLDFAFLGQDSIVGAAYGRAVWKLYPDKYYAWREAMYRAQDEEGDQGFGDEASIVKLTATISGIDAVKVKSDVAANKSAYDAMIESDRQEANRAGVQATPSVLIGNKIISGAYPYATFEEVIEAELK